MNKLKMAFFISLLFVLILSITSICAAECDSLSDANIQEYPSDANIQEYPSDANIQEYHSGESIQNEELNENIADNNGLNGNDVLENKESVNYLLDNADELEDDGLGDALNGESKSQDKLSENAQYDSSNDCEIAKEIKVNFSSKVYKNDTGNIYIELPESASGYLRVLIDDVEIYNQSISNKTVNVPIVIPKTKFPIFVSGNIDYTSHIVDVFYNDISLNCSKVLKLMHYPPDCGFHIGVPEEVLKGDNQSFQTVSLIFPSSANGTVDVYIDGNFFERLNATKYTFLNMSRINSLSLGKHTIKAIYSGDDYYLPCEMNSSFSVVDFLISIPKNIVLDHDDCIYAKSVKYTDGTISVFFDGKKIYSKKLDKYHEFLESLFSKVTCGEHLIEVRYSSSKFNYSKKQNVNISYMVDIWGGDFRYGDENIVNVVVPTDFNASRVKITIDKKAYPVRIDSDGWISMNVSKLNAGNHTLVFTFLGDKKYYKYSETYNFTVFYGFKVPTFVDYLDGSVVSIDLPSSAKGNLELYIKNKLYKSVKLNNGTASIRVDQLACNMYDIFLKYTGNDFNVENLSASLLIYPKVISPYNIKCGENKSIVVQVSKDSKGYVVFTAGKTKYKVPIKDGKAILSLKNFKIGEYDIDIDYVGENGFNCSDYAYVNVSPAKIKITGAKNLVVRYKTGKYYKVRVYNNQSKLAKGVIVSFKVGKKTYKVKTDNKGIAKLRLSRFAPKSYKIIISYKGTKLSKKLTVRHILKLKKAKIRKSAKKLVLTASLSKVDGKYLKNKIIKFKFKGKVYKARTNSKGIAKLTIKRKVIKNLKIGKKITYKAIYLKDIAKRTVKVKK